MKQHSDHDLASQADLLSADRSSPVYLTVIVLTLKEKHFNLYNYLANFSYGGSVRLSLVLDKITFQELQTEGHLWEAS